MSSMCPSRCTCPAVPASSGPARARAALLRALPNCDKSLHAGLAILRLGQPGCMTYRDSVVQYLSSESTETTGPGAPAALLCSLPCCNWRWQSRGPLPPT